MLHETTAADVRDAVRSLELSGRPLCVHSSLRSFGHIDGGADAVLDVLLSEGCSIMVPAFVYDNQVAPPPGAGYARNGGAPEAGGPVALDIDGYSTTYNQIDPSMGTLPRRLLLRPQRARGDHPLNSFAALGPLAAELVARQTPLDVYAPLRALADAGGVVVLMGVGLTNLTLLHEAERSAGRELFRRWAVSGGQVVETAVGSCSAGFEALAPALAPIRRTAMAGSSAWQAYDAAGAVARAAAAVAREPSITHCDDPGCERCNDAVLGGPILN